MWGAVFALLTIGAVDVMVVSGTLALALYLAVRRY